MEMQLFVIDKIADPVLRIIHIYQKWDPREFTPPVDKDTGWGGFRSLVWVLHVVRNFRLGEATQPVPRVMIFRSFKLADLQHG